MKPNRSPFPSALPRITAALALSGLLGAPAFAQAPPDDLPPPQAPQDAPEAPDEAPRSRPVRITLTNGKVVEGELLSHKQGSYRLRTFKRELSLSEAEVKKVEFLPDRVNIDADDLSLRETLNSIARQSGRTIGVEAEAGEFRVNVSLRQIPWREAVYIIARMTGCHVEEVGESFYLSKQAKITLSFTNGDLRAALLLAGAYAGRNLVLAPKIRGSITCDLTDVEFNEALKAIAYACSFELSSKREGVISARPLAQRPTPPKPRWLPFPQPQPQGALPPKRVSLDLQKVPLEDAAERIGVLVDRNILVTPGTQALVNLSLRNAPWPEAVQLLARQARCRMRTSHGIVFLEQPPQNALMAKNVPAAAWFRALARVRGKHVIVAPEVNGLLEVNLAQAFLDEAFEQSARAYGYQVAEFGDITVVVGKRYDPSAKPTGVRVHQVLPEADPKAPAAAPKLTKEQIAAFKQRVDAAIDALEAAATKQDLDGTVLEFQRFQTLLRQGEAHGSLDPADVARYKTRLARLGDVALSLELQIFIQEGTVLLKAMGKAIEDKEPRKALVHQAQLEQLAAEMRRKEPEVFKRNAEALVRRGRQLADEALGSAGAIRTPGGPHRLNLESILWSGPAARQKSVCVILGRVYTEGDTYLLPSDEELAGVKVKRVAKDHVVLDVRGKDLRLEIK